MARNMCVAETVKNGGERSPVLLHAVAAVAVTRAARAGLRALRAHGAEARPLRHGEHGRGCQPARLAAGRARARAQPLSARTRQRPDL
jgi:hypothetical protein